MLATAFCNPQYQVKRDPALVIEDAKEALALLDRAETMLRIAAPFYVKGSTCNPTFIHETPEATFEMLRDLRSVATRNARPKAASELAFKEAVAHFEVDDPEATVRAAAAVEKALALGDGSA